MATQTDSYSEIAPAVLRAARQARFAAERRVSPGHLAAARREVVDAVKAAFCADEPCCVVSCRGWPYWLKRAIVDELAPLYPVAEDGHSNLLVDLSDV